MDLRVEIGTDPFGDYGYGVRIIPAALDATKVIAGLKTNSQFHLAYGEDDWATFTTNGPTVHISDEHGILICGESIADDPVDRCNGTAEPEFSLIDRLEVAVVAREILKVAA